MGRGELRLIQPVDMSDLPMSEGQLRAALRHCAKATTCEKCPAYVDDQCRSAESYLKWMDKAEEMIARLTNEYEAREEYFIRRTSYSQGLDLMRMKKVTAEIRQAFGKT